MLIRIAQNRKAYVWAQWGMMSLFFIADGGALFYIIFQCKPVSYAWNTNQDGYCLPASWLADVYYVCTAVNIMTDWVTALLYVLYLHLLSISDHVKYVLTCSPQAYPSTMECEARA